jgi:very-short-patch-repair endonuclease
VNKPLVETVDFLPEPTQRQQIVTTSPPRLPGVYSWLRFGEYFTRDDWVESFGIDLARIDEKAAHAYLDGEAAFFKNFAQDCAAAIGMPRVAALRQAKLESSRGRFINAATRLCGSPIEQIMLAALMWTEYGYEKKLIEIAEPGTRHEATQSNVVIAPQHLIGRHTVDFGIFVRFVANEEIRIVVECDGHDFHEKTKEQAARDKSRQCDLEIAGWRVMRFTGSMIWRDHKWCADRVAKLVTNELEAQLHRRGWV